MIFVPEAFHRHTAVALGLPSMNLSKRTSSIISQPGPLSQHSERVDPCNTGCYRMPSIILFYRNGLYT